MSGLWIWVVIWGEPKLLEGPIPPPIVEMPLDMAYRIRLIFQSAIDRGLVQVQ